MTTASQTMLLTERLRFETWRLEDSDLLFDLHADARVKRGYPAEYQWTTEATQSRLASYMKEQVDFGYTKWKLCLHDGTFIGRAGWSPWGELKAELGYALKPQYWNQGYAHEAASALLTWCQVNHPRVRLVGFALTSNVPSRRILEKIGMKLIDFRIIGDHENAFYEYNN